MQQRQTPQEKDISTKLIKRVDSLEKKMDKLMKHLGEVKKFKFKPKVTKREKQPKKS